MTFRVRPPLFPGPESHRGSTLRRPALLALALLLATSLASHASAPLDLFVDSPILGQFMDDTSVTVAGRVIGPQSSVASLEVNGQSALPIAPDGTWSATLTLDAAEIFHPIQVDLTNTESELDREIITVILGDSILEGERAESGAALRLNDAGLGALAGSIAGDLDIDIASLLPPGTMLISNYCYQYIFWCIGRISASVSSSPPPSIGGTGIAIDSRTDAAHVDIALNEVFLNVDIYSTSGISISCDLTVTASLMRLGANLIMQPLASNPSEMDVIQQGNIENSFVNLQNNAGCSGFLSSLIEGLVEDTAEGMIQDEVSNLMNALDADGNTPIAAAFEEALGGLELANEIGSGLELDVDAIFNEAVIDEAGTTLDLDIAFAATSPDPAAVDLSASLSTASVLPAYAATTPAGAPYDLALGVDPAAFNSLLKAETEKGLLITSITEITLIDDPIPLTAGLVSFLAPAFSALPGGLPLRFDLEPQLAPVVTGADGPNGETAELQVAHLLLTVRSNDGSETEHLSFVVDLTVGLNAELDELGQLNFSLGTLDPTLLGVAIIDNPLGVDEASFAGVIQVFLPTLFPEIAASLGAFPLPSLAGLTFSLVEASRNGDFLSLFLSVPKNDDQHAVLFDGLGVVVYETEPGNFSGGHYVQALPTSFETASNAGDNQLGFFGNRSAVLNNGANVSVHSFSPVVGFTQTGVTQQYADLPAGFENGVNAEDNVLDFPIPNLAVLYNGVGVTLHDWDGEQFSGSRSIQGIPAGFETGSVGKDNNLMFIDPSTAWLYDGGTIKEFRFSPHTGFEFVANVQGAPAFFESGSNAADNQLGYTMAPPTDPSAPNTCTAVLYDGVVVRLYDFDNENGFTNMRYVQGTPENFEWDGAQNQDNHLAFYSATQAAYIDSQTVRLYGFTPLSGFSYSGETGQNTTCTSCPPISETGEDALDNQFDFADPVTAVLFDGQNVILYDWGSDLLTNPQPIQGVPPGFETGASAHDNHLAFANPNQAVYFDGLSVTLYDFDTTNGFTNPQTIQGVPEEFETGSDARENVLSILPGCIQPPPPLCTGDEATGDTDGDGVCDDIDPCPNDAGDDSDGDGSCDSLDLCTGDDSTGDTDADGACDDTDACPSDPGDDSDGDGSCDSLDLCAGDDSTGDTDADGSCDDTDPCPNDANDDSDADGSCDSVDLCTGDDASGDSDADGTCDDSDAFPNDANETTDSDADGIGDNEEVAAGTDPFDPDSDDDGWTDLEEKLGNSDPLDPASTPGGSALPSLGILGSTLLGLLLLVLGSRSLHRSRRNS